MNVEIVLSNKQKRKKLNLQFLRRIIAAIIEIGGRTIPDCISSSYEIGVHIVSKEEMAMLNERYLGHKGATDVITFSHDVQQFSEIGELWLWGDIFVCIDVAITQAKEFKASWQSEVIRYIAHGFLHLRGYDDKTKSALRIMKPLENELVHELAGRFDLRRLDIGRKAPKLNA